MDEAGEADSLFGYERVRPAEKTARVKRVFDAVSPRYDLMNDLMSAGMHRLWKRFAVTLLKLRPGHVVLDLAGGTGDIARLLARRFPGQNRVLVSYECDDPRRAYIETIAVGEELPDMPLYLAAGHPIVVPLAATYGTAWAACPEALREAVHSRR